MANYSKRRAISWEEAQEARERYENEEDASIRSLADDYGICKSSMNRLLKGVTYKEPLPDEKEQE